MGSRAVGLPVSRPVPVEDPDGGLRMIRAGTSCAADDHSAALSERSRRNTNSAPPHRPASG